MIKKFVYILISFLIINQVSAFDIRQVNNAKVMSEASYAVNDTNLVDEENADNLLMNIDDLNSALKIKEKEIQKDNKDRKQRKKKGAEEIFSEYSNSVVFIGNRQKGKIDTIGSGFIINHNGLKIITNWHVIEGAEKLDVWLKPKKMVNEEFLIRNVDSYQGKLIKVNKKKDLAMMEVINLPIKIKPVIYGKFEKVRIGETLFAIGHPAGLLWSFNEGMVSQIRPEYRWKYRSSSHSANVIQIQVPINPGNSGGPLFNKKKELVGVNTFTADGENLNFAISVDDVIEFLNEKPKIKKKSKSKWLQKKDKGSTWIKKKEKKSTKGSIDLSNAKEVDVNKNGVIDAWLIDENNNGIYEKAYGDTDENGVIDVLVIDKDENKIYELTIIDNDENGNPDIAEYDENEDGSIDIIAYDYNQDGEWDKYERI